MQTILRDSPPAPDLSAGMSILRSFLGQRSPLAALSRMHAELGDVFQIPLPGFSPYVLVGPEANRFILASERQRFLWRNEGDPVTRLLQEGLLVLDGDLHDQMRRVMNPALHRRMLSGYFDVMLASTDDVLDRWVEGTTIDLLDEMRKVALLILMRTLFRVDFTNDLTPLWPSILRSIRFISPGPWVIWPSLTPRRLPQSIRVLDEYLYGMIAERRKEASSSADLLSLLVRVEGMSDSMIRDQLVTMLIAGHDTSTSLLAWALYLIFSRPRVRRGLNEELVRVYGEKRPVFKRMGELDYLDRVIKETLRLYPPIHLGSRIAAEDLSYRGYRIPEGTRVIYSIYLTHRLERYWPDPDRFNPDRFLGDSLSQLPPYTYLPFGGGPRNCIGYAFAQMEVRAVLARILQRFDIRLIGPNPQVRMGATLEPAPGIKAVVRARKSVTIPFDP